MSDSREQEPLLGRPGDVLQRERPIYENLVLGSGIIAQVGIWILTAVVWSGIFSHDLMLFSAHPLLNSAGLLLITQGLLILQPTHTPEQKKVGTYLHAAFVDLGLAALISGLIVIEVNKARNHPVHFDSAHSRLGLITYILIFCQAFVGVTQFFVPQLYGGVDNAKKLYKYHRASGYLILAVAFATVAAATWTPYIEGSFGIQKWAVIVAEVLALAGLYSRIKKEKLRL